MKERDKRTDKRVSEKKIEQVPNSIRRSLRNHFPKILTIRASDPFLSYENSGEKDNEDTYMKTPKERLGGDIAAEEGTNVNPEAQNEANE